MGELHMNDPLCDHLVSLELAMLERGLPPTYRGQPWSQNCRQWVYFDCYIDTAAVRRRFDLAPCVSEHARHAAPGALQRCRASLHLDYERWRDGIGYDMDAYAQMTHEERDTVAAEVRPKGDTDWRDLEVLGAHRSATAPASSFGASSRAESHGQRARPYGRRRRS
jgi:hypothetical protein